MATSGEIYEALRLDVVNGRYRPLDIVEPRKIAEEHLTSSAPVREALLRLSERGLIRWERNRGFFLQKVLVSEALFLLVQLEEAYKFAFKRIEERPIDIGSLNNSYLIDEIGGIEQYKTVQNAWAKIIFSDIELNNVVMNFDIIWEYRNLYLKDENIYPDLFELCSKAYKNIYERDTAKAANYASKVFDIARKHIVSTN